MVVGGTYASDVHPATIEHLAVQPLEEQLLRFLVDAGHHNLVVVWSGAVSAARRYIEIDRDQLEVLRRTGEFHLWPLFADLHFLDQPRHVLFVPVDELGRSVVGDRILGRRRVICGRRICS